jgi:hypothetical protein
MSKKPKVIHRKQLFGGIKSAAQVHWEGFPLAKCPCGLDPIVRALSFAPIADLLDKDPLLLRQLSDRNGGNLPLLELKYGTFVRIGEMFACTLCRSTLEKAMAKLPSYVLVEFDTGPSPDRPVVQVLA